MKKKMIKNMNSKMTTNYYQQPDLKKKKKQTTKTGTESQKLRLHGGLSVRRGREENGGKVIGNKNKRQVENRQGKVKNSIRNVEAEEFVCTIPGHELRGEGKCG